jgi:hypothetical protein
VLVSWLLARSGGVWAWKGYADGNAEFRGAVESLLARESVAQSRSGPQLSAGKNVP